MAVVVLRNKRVDRGHTTTAVCDSVNILRPGQYHRTKSAGQKIGPVGVSDLEVAHFVSCFSLSFPHNTRRSGQTPCLCSDLLATLQIVIVGHGVQARRGHLSRV